MEGLPPEAGCLGKHRSYVLFTFCFLKGLPGSCVLPERKKGHRCVIYFKMRSTSPTTVSQLLDNRILSILALISSDFHKRLTRSYLARQVHLSESRLGALFRQTGMTIHQAVSFKRMERAADLLRTTDLLVKEVAYRTGIVDQSHFGRDFTKVYGLSPAAYRLFYRRNSEAQQESS